MMFVKKLMPYYSSTSHHSSTYHPFWAFACLLFVLVQLVACSSSRYSSSRYSMHQDIGPTGDFDASKVPDAVPVWEAMSVQGNKSPYWVRGKEYQILSNVKGFEETGIASWYGLKFHGELTSNGEIYNMYGLSAAHKALPLPTYLRVTNLENQKSIVVRVNDRGPFHSDRIIDLSYAAAKKLGYQKKGTAKVKIEAITSPNPSSTKDEPYQQDVLANFIQVAAFSSLSSAELVKAQSEVYSDNHEVFVAESSAQKGVVYRVRIGPFPDLNSAKSILNKLHQAKVGHAILITRSIGAKDI